MSNHHCRHISKNRRCIRRRSIHIPRRSSRRGGNAPEAATPNSLVLLDYEGTLDDGTVFDSGENVEFYLPQMVAGFQNAIVGMRAGETKTFSIPPEEAYGAEGSGPIPPNATLNFEVTVHEILR